jgi:hypothetical protein
MISIGMSWDREIVRQRERQRDRER